MGQHQLAVFGLSLDGAKTISDLVANAITAGAVIAGALWAYWRFVRERTRWPQASLELVTSHLHLKEGRILLHVKLKVHNTGRGLMKLSMFRIDLRRVLPLSEETGRRVDRDPMPTDQLLTSWWPYIGWRIKKWDPSKPERVLGENRQPELEPGESEEFGCDFIISGSEETVFLYVYLQNIAKKRGNHELGWSAMTYYDLSEADGSHSSAS